MEGIKKVRPYWHVDLKWVFGIFFALLLSQTLFVYSLKTITAPKTAIDSLTIVVASMFSRKGLDDVSEIEKMRAELAADPNKKVKVGQMEVPVTYKDLEGKSPREARLMIFREVIKPAYTRNFDLTGLAEGDEMRKNLEKQGGLINIITQENHERVGTVFRFLLMATIVSLIPFIYFSSRFGRLFNPGLVLVIVSLFPALIVSLVKMFLETHPQEATGEGSQALYALSNVGPLMLPIIQKTYMYALLIGLALVVASALGKVIFRVFKKEPKTVQSS